ncbi:helix-turn-helix transcriptional regulator [Sanyastnella coralliicola]|uniref:helix-turn-helix transcriptional regulator n=1 Tax=Sanyastnella coralliicola TaxID=3069118 RepID=UPI0027BA0282|nr:YafY family protein [Longitalea sp. SCSIO 12813]
MNRLTRITAIITQLQSKRVITAQEIADRFDVSLRTVYRDLKTIQEAGVPIGSENGLGYYIVEGFNLPPIALTEEEAHALLISQQFIQKQGDASLTKNFNSLMMKIKSVLKEYQKDDAELMEDRLGGFVQGPVHSSSWLAEIQRAIARKIRLKIKYHSAYKDELTEREVSPMAVYFANNAWITVAWCHLRNEYREFRLDRILLQMHTINPFHDDEDFRLDTYFESLQH